MKLNTHPENRKEMVRAISELTGLEATYMFTPTYSFKIGPITVAPFRRLIPLSRRTIEKGGMNPPKTITVKMLIRS